MAQQVAEWEEKIRDLVSRDNKEWEIFTEENSNALPITLEIHLVNWINYMNKDMT